MITSAVNTKFGVYTSEQRSNSYQYPQSGGQPAIHSESAQSLNLAAFRYLLDTSTNYFWHQTDDYTLTSRGYIWTYPGRELTQRSVMVMPEHVDPTLANCRNIGCFAICTDYVKTVQSFYK